MSRCYQRLSTRLVLLLFLLSSMFSFTATYAQPTSLTATRELTQRWIVQLRDPPLAQAPNISPAYAIMSEQSAPRGKLQVESAESKQYRAFLIERQQSVLNNIQQIYPAVQVHHTYTIVFNGMSLAIPGSDETVQAQLQAIPGVAKVYREQTHELNMYSSIPLMNTPALWNDPSIGGQERAGEGIKVAVIDTGIKIDHTFFNPEGFSYPPGFPKGETDYTTPKVIVSRAYFRPDIPPTEGSETPQPGPYDASHGTHVAGTIAGVANTTATIQDVSEVISGVAPRAYLMNYKAFYDNDSIFSGIAFETELIAAIEDAVADGADIISNSWGGLATVSARFNPIAVAANAAADAGVTVVFSAGNSGPHGSTVDSTDFTNKLIIVGASTTGQTIAAGFVDVVAPDGVPETITDKPYGNADFGAILMDNLFGPVSYIPVETLACDPLPEGSLSGHIALIERGTCHFSTKAFYAQQAGAVGAIVYNTDEGGDTIITMAAGDYAEEVEIPAVFIERTAGLAMIDWYNQHGGAVQVQIDPRPRVIDMTPDVVAFFSSRGPTFQGELKPDVVAPGVNILSSGYDPFAEGIESHMGFGLSSGTSMAAPHVSGAAALLKQAHPDWAPLDIKSALMTTAKTELWLDSDKTALAGVLTRGAGRIELGNAVNPGLLFETPSLSFGNIVPSIDQPVHKEFTVHARNISGATQNYTVNGYQTGENGFSINVSPASFTVGSGETAHFTVAVDMPAGAAPGDYEGQVDLLGGPTPLHLPVWARLMPAEPGNKVLLIDNDGSSSFELHNYSDYYTNLLGELGVSYTYLDVDALAGEMQTIPDISELQKYEVILWFTGDNYFPDGSVAVPVPLTETDQSLIIAYLQSGGNLIATGQDLAEASDIETFPDDDQYGRSDLYRYFLGARFIKDDVFEDVWEELPDVVGIGDEQWLSNIRIDLNNPLNTTDQTGDWNSAGNQVSVDESKVIDMDPRMPDEYTFPMLMTASPGAEADGIVALHRFSSPTLENPEPAFIYRTTYLGFGLEGVRSDTGKTTRKEFLQQLLYWHVAYPGVKIDTPTVTVDANQSVQLTAHASSSVPSTFVRYRWDFGDGTPFVETDHDTVEHQYAASGTYHVRVEVTDNWGHKAVSGVLNNGERRLVGGNTGQGSNTADMLASMPQQPVQMGETQASPMVNHVTFAETGQTLQGRFLDFWQQHGGLAVFGFPISTEQAGDQLSQVFERVRFEHHPENAAPYDVLLGRIGIESLEAQGRDWFTFSTVDEAPEGCHYFAETGHSLCGNFKEYWDRHGLEFDGNEGTSFAESLALFGLPVSEPQIETIEGKTLTVQWFERARFEYHEDLADTPVLLGRLGSEVYSEAE